MHIGRADTHTTAGLAAAGPLTGAAVGGEKGARERWPCRDERAQGLSCGVHEAPATGRVHLTRRKELHSLELLRRTTRKGVEGER